MSTPFKMKGSPMQRNFGIGSPMRNDKETMKEFEAREKAKEESDKILYGDRVSDESPGEGWKNIKGTNIWENIEYKDKIREKKAMEARYKRD